MSMFVRFPHSPHLKSHFLIYLILGDNMLTALSVARDCQMIEPNGKTILVHVVPPIGSQQPYIEWTYAEDTKQKVKEVTTGSAVRK